MTNIIVTDDINPRTEVLEALGMDADVPSSGTVNLGDELNRIWSALRVCLLCIDKLGQDRSATDGA